MNLPERDMCGLAPHLFVPEYTDEQLRFLALHRDDVVTKSMWFMMGSQLRAYTDCGRVATISADALDHLVDTGAVELIGCAGVRLTKREVR